MILTAFSVYYSRTAGNISRFLEAYQLTSHVTRNITPVLVSNYDYLALEKNKQQTVVGKKSNGLYVVY